MELICRFLGRVLYAALVLRDFIRGVEPPTPRFNHVPYDIIDEATGQVVGHKEKP